MEPTKNKVLVKIAKQKSSSVIIVESSKIEYTIHKIGKDCGEDLKIGMKVVLKDGGVKVSDEYLIVEETSIWGYE